jgi:hypothetical protein
MIRQFLTGLLAMAMICIALPLGAATITSHIKGVTYEDKEWAPVELQTFMTKLADTTVKYHAKREKQSPMYGLIYEYALIKPDGDVLWKEGVGLDTMHDGAWFGNALAAAYRTTQDKHFLDLLNEYTLRYYPNVLNNSDKYFVLGLKDGEAWKDDYKDVPIPAQHSDALVSKGICPYWWADGDAVAIEANSKPLIGYKSGKYTSLHMADDLAVMLGMTATLTQRDDVKLALKHLALSDRQAYGGEGYSPGVNRVAQSIIGYDEEIKAKWGPLRFPPPAKVKDPEKPPFSRGYMYDALIRNLNRGPADLDGTTWRYYHGVLSQHVKPLDDEFAKQVIANVYGQIVWNQLWYGKSPRQPGSNKFDIAGMATGEKYKAYFADVPNYIQGSRGGPMIIWNAAIGLQLLKAFPAAWELYRDQYCPNDVPVEIRWTSPVVDGSADAQGYGKPITIADGVTVRLASSLDTLYLLLDRAAGTAVSMEIFGLADAKQPGAKVNLAADGTLTATGRDDAALLNEVKSSKQGARELVEIALPYTVVKEQQPWANACDDARLSLRGVNGQVTNLIFLSSPSTVETILRKECIEGLRFWEFILSDWGFIPSGFYPERGKNGIWNGFSDTGGYAHLINATAAYSQYLQGKNDWELYNNVRAK